MTAELAELNRTVAEKLGWTHDGTGWLTPAGEFEGFNLPDFTTGEWTARLLEALSRKYERYGQIRIWFDAAYSPEQPEAWHVYCSAHPDADNWYDSPPTLGIAAALAFAAEEGKGQ